MLDDLTHGVPRWQRQSANSGRIDHGSTRCWAEFSKGSTRALFYAIRHNYKSDRNGFLLPGVKGLRFMKFLSAIDCAVSGSNSIGYGCCKPVRTDFTFEVEVLGEAFSYSKRWGLTFAYFIFHPGIALITKILSDFRHSLQNSARIHRQWFFRLGIKERNKEKWDVIFPWNSSEGWKVDHRDDIAISIRSVRYQELTRVHCIVDIPTAKLFF